MQIDRKELLAAIKLVSKAIPSRPSVSVLAGILFDVADGMLTLTGFDIDNGIQVEMPIDDKSERLTVLIPVKPIQAALNNFHSEAIEITIQSTLIDVDIQSTSIVISSGSAQIEIQLMPNAEDYPSQCFDVSGIDIQSIDRSIIDGMMSVLFATSTDPSKQILQAVNVAADGEQATFAATDGHRLAVTKLASGLQIEAISLGNSGLRLLSGFEFSDREINIYRVDGGLIIAHEGIKFLIREIEGKYPDYPLLLPTQFKIQLTVDRSNLVQAIDLANIENTNNLIKLNIEDDLLVSSDNEAVKSSSIVTAESTGGSIIFAMNSSYLLDALKQITTDKVVLDINDPLSPIVTTWQIDQVQRTILLMPVQIRS
jgi:DNA polymerase III subunit beta